MKFLLLFLFVSSNLISQNSFVSSGDTYTNNGSFSYSVGQISLNQIINSEGSLFEGIQQPFEILTLNIIDNFTKLSDINSYPNPTKGAFFIELKNNNSFPYKLKIYDLRGSLIYSKDITHTISEINLKTKPNGVYLVQLIKEGKRLQYFKIIKN